MRTHECLINNCYNFGIARSKGSPKHSNWGVELLVYVKIVDNFISELYHKPCFTMQCYLEVELVEV